MVRVCPFCHTVESNSIHGDKNRLKEDELQISAQLAWQTIHKTDRESFIKRFGKGYA